MCIHNKICCINNSWCQWLSISEASVYGVSTSMGCVISRIEVDVMLTIGDMGSISGADRGVHSASSIPAVQLAVVECPGDAVVLVLSYHHPAPPFVQHPPPVTIRWWYSEHLPGTTHIVHDIVSNSDENLVIIVWHPKWHAGEYQGDHHCMLHTHRGHISLPHTVTKPIIIIIIYEFWQHFWIRTNTQQKLKQTFSKMTFTCSINGLDSLCYVIWSHASFVLN